MITNELAARMTTALKLEDDILPTEVKEFPVKAAKGYYVNRGTVEFSRGTTIEAYVYIEHNDGDVTAERLYTEQEFKLWTEHLA